MQALMEFQDLIGEVDDSVFYCCASNMSVYKL